MDGLLRIFGAPKMKPAKNSVITSALVSADQQMTEARAAANGSSRNQGAGTRQSGHNLPSVPYKPYKVVKL